MAIRNGCEGSILRTATLALTAAALLAGCGAELGTQPITRFPSRDALSAIEAKPVRNVAVPKTAGAVESWDIEMAPQADAIGAPWKPMGRWEPLFAEAAARAARPPTLSLAMSCVAQEFGRFQLEHNAEPDESLRRFLIGGCGALVPDVAGTYVTLDAPASIDDEELFNQLGASLRPGFEKALARGGDLAGFWFGRRGDQAIAFVVTADEKAKIKPFSLAPNAEGEVIIEGRLREEARFFEALVNYGSAAAAPCEVDIAVQRPSFRFVCRLAPGDETAWIQMLYAPPERVLGTVFAQALARRSLDVPPSYHPVRYADPTPVASAPEFRKAVFSALNRVRTAAKLAPVTLAEAETATATKVAPHYFAAALGQAPMEEADTIALGLMAGWDVGGMIRGASFMSALIPTTDAGRWLTSALEMPVGRSTLFAPDIEQIALGPMVFGRQGALASVVAGYRFHHGTDHSDDVKWLLTRVIQARRRMELSAPLRLAGFAPEMEDELLSVNKGDIAPFDALSHVLERASAKYNLPMTGFLIEASTIDELEMPAEVLRQRALRMDIGVTHHKAPGAAWAQYTIFVIYAVETTDGA